jgi:hypothetical protein
LLTAQFIIGFFKVFEPLFPTDGICDANVWITRLPCPLHPSFFPPDRLLVVSKSFPCMVLPHSTYYVRSATFIRARLGIAHGHSEDSDLEDQHRGIEKMDDDDNGYILSVVRLINAQRTCTICLTNIHPEPIQALPFYDTVRCSSSRRFSFRHHLFCDVFFFCRQTSRA